MPHNHRLRRNEYSISATNVDLGVVAWFTYRLSTGTPLRAAFAHWVLNSLGLSNLILHFSVCLVPSSKFLALNLYTSRCSPSTVSHYLVIININHTVRGPRISKARDGIGSTPSSSVNASLACPRSPIASGRPLPSFALCHGPGGRQSSRTARPGCQLP